jgi:hypothetical protein
MAPIKISLNRMTLSRMALNRMKLIEMTLNRMTSAKRDGALLEWIYFCDILKGELHLFYLSNSYLGAILGGE